tara:strand:- start:190 stop:555 length:366 start_codon:yes stop_codon:yes gene_type:complete
MVNLQRTVELYCIAMENFEICRANYKLPVHQIKYENLIDNFKGEITSLIKFLDLEWDSKMENFRDTAIKRGRINTPSYSQVVQPIYGDAKYRWVQYSKYLEKYLDEIMPWINKFEYNHIAS